MEKRATNTSKNKEFLRISELAKLSDTRVSTIKFYSDLGLLPFEQKGKGLTRRYPKDEALKRLKEIQKLKDKRFTIMEIKEKILDYKSDNC